VGPKAGMDAVEKIKTLPLPLILFLYLLPFSLRNNLMSSS
jgi:hypothetical protein